MQVLKCWHRKTYSKCLCKLPERQKVDRYHCRVFNPVNTLLGYQLICFTHLILWKGSDLAASMALDLTVATILSQAGNSEACAARKEARVWP